MPIVRSKRGNTYNTDHMSESEMWELIEALDTAGDVDAMRKVERALAVRQGRPADYYANPDKYNR